MFNSKFSGVFVQLITNKYIELCGAYFLGIQSSFDT